MKVWELIEALKTMPMDAGLLYWYDSAARGYVEKIILRSDKKVVCLSEEKPGGYSDEYQKEYQEDYQFDKGEQE